MDINTFVKFREDEITKKLNRAAQEMDEALLKFFGSEEELRLKYHLYTIDEYTEFSGLYSDSDGNYKMTAQTTWRIRKKTKAELDAESSQEIHGL